MLIMVGTGVFVGNRVDHTIRSRARAESASQDRMASERRYCGLFEGAGEPTLVFGADGQVQEGNASAGDVLGRSPSLLQGESIGELTGLDVTRLDGMDVGAVYVAKDVRLVRPAGSEVWLQPVCTTLSTADDGAQIQAVLRNVTDRCGFGPCRKDRPCAGG